MKKSKYQQCFHCFIICILGPMHFGSASSGIIVTILISAVFRGAVLIRGEALIITNPSCIDSFLINTIRSFQETQVFETGLSDFHKIVVTVLEYTFPK